MAFDPWTPELDALPPCQVSLCLQSCADLFGVGSDCENRSPSLSRSELMAVVRVKSLAAVWGT